MFIEHNNQMIKFQRAMEMAVGLDFPDPDQNDLSDYIDGFRRGYYEARMYQNMNEARMYAIEQTFPNPWNVAGSWARMTFYSDGYTRGWEYWKIGDFEVDIPTSSDLSQD